MCHLKVLRNNFPQIIRRGPDLSLEIEIICGPNDDDDSDGRQIETQFCDMRLESLETYIRLGAYQLIILMINLIVIFLHPAFISHVDLSAWIQFTFSNYWVPTSGEAFSLSVTHPFQRS